MKGWIGTVLLGLLLLGAPATGSAMTLREYMANERGTVKGAAPGITLAYLWGTLDGIGALGKASKIRFFCIDEGNPQYKLLQIDAFKGVVTERIEAIAAKEGGLDGKPGDAQVGASRRPAAHRDVPVPRREAVRQESHAILAPLNPRRQHRIDVPRRPVGGALVEPRGDAGLVLPIREDEEARLAQRHVEAVGGEAGEFRKAGARRRHVAGDELEGQGRHGEREAP